MAAPAVPDARRTPVLEPFATPRLLLRPFTVADVPRPYEALAASIEVLRDTCLYVMLSGEG